MTATETVAAAVPTAPAQPPPPGAWDCHAHVFGPFDRFPPGPATYPIPVAPPEIYGHMLERVGLDRGVLVQPAPYGQDTAALEHALGLFGGHVRGIAVADASVTDERLAALHAAGVRGLRFIEMRDPRSGERYAGSVGVADLGRLGPRMRSLGWHAQIWARCEEIPRLVDAYGPLGLPLVFDHMGQFDASKGPDDGAFRAFLDLVARGQAWTKLSLCRLSRLAPGYEDLESFHRGLVQANPGRLLWGSDWPFVRMGAASPDVGRLLDVFQTFVADPAVVRRILVDNPAELFDRP